MSGLTWESCGARIHSHQLVGLQSHTWSRYTMLASPIHCPQTHFTCLRCLYSEFQWHILNYYLPHLSFHVGPWPHHTWMCGKCLADKRVTSYKILPITHGSQSLITWKWVDQFLWRLKQGHVSALFSAVSPSSAESSVAQLVFLEKMWWSSKEGFQDLPFLHSWLEAGTGMRWEWHKLI